MKKFILTSLLAISIFACSMPADSSEVIVYSGRKENLIKPLFEKFTLRTGIKVQFISGDPDALLHKILEDGKFTNADMLISVDAGNLWHAAEDGIFQPVNSEILKLHIPSNLKDLDNRWFAVTKRSRTIVYSSDRVKASDLGSYEGLADKKWRDRLCLTSAEKVYNQALVAMFIIQYGISKTEDIIKGWVANKSGRSFIKDTDAIKAIINGQCDVAIVNTYYLGRLLAEMPDAPVKIFWANQEGSGVHVNISGAGITKYAKNVDNAVKLLEWLVSEEAQADFAKLGFEYPVLAGVPVHPIVSRWGKFKANDLNIIWLGEKEADAKHLMKNLNYK